MGYDAESSRNLCRKSRAESCIGKRGQPHGFGLDMRCWPMERINSWLLETKRPGLRYDRPGHIVEDPLQTACVFLVAPGLTRGL